MNKLLCALAGLAVAWGACAQDAGMVTRSSKYPVAETMDRVEASVKAAGGFQVFTRVDFQAVAAAQGGKIRPSQILIFGRGQVLQPLLVPYPAAALELPLKILVWEDENGKVMISYNTGEYMAQRHGVKGKDDVLKRISDVTASFANTAAD
jgi:uncharacterized protein (DUF302 family)